MVWPVGLLCVLVGMEGAQRWLAAWQSLERQRPQSQGSADQDNNEAYDDDDEAEDYDIRVKSGVAGITHGLSVAPRARAGNRPFCWLILLPSIALLAF